MIFFSFVLVYDMVNEWRDQEYVCFSICMCLCEREQQSQVIVDVFFFKNFCCVDIFLSRSQFDQDMIVVDVCIVVYFYQLMCFCYVVFGVVRKMCVNFS